MLSPIRVTAQEATIASGLVNSVLGGLSVNLIGYGLASIGLNAQAQSQHDILNQLTAIDNELDTISTQLT